MNRPVRTRMPGGVGGSRSNPGSLSRSLLCEVLANFRYRRSPESDLLQCGLLALGHDLDRTSMLAISQSCDLQARTQAVRAAKGIPGSVHRSRVRVQDARYRERLGLLPESSFENRRTV